MGPAFRLLPQPGTTSLGVSSRHRSAVLPPDLRSVLPRNLRCPGAGALIHDVQIIGADGERHLEPAALAAELPVLIVPGLLVADDALLTWLRDYAAAGGHLVIGPRTAYGDEEGRARLEVKPAHLARAEACATRSSPT